MRASLLGAGPADWIQHDIQRVCVGYGLTASLQLHNQHSHLRLSAGQPQHGDRQLSHQRLRNQLLFDCQ